MKTTFNDPDEFLKFLIRNIANVVKVAIKEHKSMSNDMVDVAKKLTSGKIKTKRLRELGHPFSRRKFSFLQKEKKASLKKRRLGLANVPLLPINRQTGVLQKSLAHRAIYYPDSLNAEQISFNAPYAKFILSARGTRKMIARGYPQAFKKLFKKRESIMKQRFRYKVVQMRGLELGGTHGR